mmetsp:Transcript_7428/g.12524  ORF Transcript_7428/g.12524 Transcript_7428/m.12524 type:complete len:329 (-) Transcript_7428:549-1535(-)
MKDTVKPGHDGQERLGCTNVRGRLFAADMLLAGLQGQPVGTIAVAVHGHTDDAARHVARIIGLRRHIGRVRATVSDRHAKALGGAHGNIRPHRPRLFQQGQRQRIGRDNADGLVRVQRVDWRCEVADMAISAGILEDRAKDGAGVQIIRAAHCHLDSQRLGAGFHHGDVLRVAVFIDKEPGDFRFADPLRHGHRLGTGGCLVQQRGVGNLKPREVRHHGLEVQQRLQPALRNLGLIGRIGRVPGRILKDVALDRGRRDRPVITLSDQRGQHLVLGGGDTHVVQQFAFRFGLAEIEGVLLPDVGRDRIVDERIKVFRPHHLQHLVHFGR